MLIKSTFTDHTLDAVSALCTLTPLLLVSHLLLIIRVFRNARHEFLQHLQIIDGSGECCCRHWAMFQTCISWIFSSSSGLMPSWPPITVSRSLLRLLFPVTETVTRTGLMATAAAAVKRAIPARGAMRRASGLAWLLAPLRSAAEIFRHYFQTRIGMSSMEASVCVNCQSGHFLHSLSSKMMMELGKTGDLTNVCLLSKDHYWSDQLTVAIPLADLGRSIKVVIFRLRPA